MDLTPLNNTSSILDDGLYGLETTDWIEASADLLLALIFLMIPIRLYLIQLKYIKWADRIRTYNFLNLFLASNAITHLMSSCIPLFEEALVVLVVTKSISTIICIVTAFLLFQFLPDIAKYQARTLLLEKELG